jgi:hypothetical protein
MNRLAPIIPISENCQEAYSDSVQTGGTPSGVALPERSLGIIPPVEIVRATNGKSFMQLLEPESE